MKTLIFINGPMGVGKSAVCRELLERLQPGAWLDGDWCWMMRPFQVTEETKAMVMDNITAVLSRFLKSPALDYVIFSWVMQHEEIAKGLLSRLDLENIAVRRYTLLCSPKILRERIAGDVAAGLRTPDAVERGLSYLPLYEGQDTVNIMTDRMSPAETADRLAGEIRGVPT